MALEPRKSDASRRATAPPEHRNGASLRGGRLSLAIHEDTRAPPAFLIELPMLAAAPLTTSTGCKLFGHRRGRLSLAIHENTRAPPPAGYAIRRKDPSDDERHVLRLLRGFSMDAGVLPPPTARTAPTASSPTCAPASSASSDRRTPRRCTCSTRTTTVLAEHKSLLCPTWIVVGYYMKEGSSAGISIKSIFDETSNVAAEFAGGRSPEFAGGRRTSVEHYNVTRGGYTRELPCHPCNK